MGPCPIQLVVPIAVKNAVSAATNTFTASSITRCFFIVSSLFFCVISPPKLGGARGGLNCLRHEPPQTVRLFRPPLARLCRFALQRTPPNLGVEEITRLLQDARRRHRRCRRCPYLRRSGFRHRSGYHHYHHRHCRLQAPADS